MRNRMLMVLCLVMALPLAAFAAPSQVTVPDDTKISTLKIDDDTQVTLKPAEQVAFLFVYAMWGLENECNDKDMGIGRPVSIDELVKGVKGEAGQVIGLSLSPRKDTNYNYDIIIVGKDVIVRAISRVKDLGSFAYAGTAGRMSGNFWFNPNGPDITKAVKFTEYGYEGHGFRRQ
jgi:hypothetical protein